MRPSAVSKKYGVTGAGRPRRVEAETAGSRLEAENHSDANPRIDTRSHLNWGEIPAAINYSPPSIGSKLALGKSSVIFAIGRIAIVITFIMSGLFRLADLDGSATIIAFNLLPLPEPLADAAASIEALSS